VGFEVRADLYAGDSAFWVQLTPGQVDSLNLAAGSEVWVRAAQGAATIVSSRQPVEVLEVDKELAVESR
jgi:hypothetical protein